MFGEDEGQAATGGEAESTATTRDERPSAVTSDGGGEGVDADGTGAQGESATTDGMADGPSGMTATSEGMGTDDSGGPAEPPPIAVFPTAPYPGTFNMFQQGAMQAANAICYQTYQASFSDLGCLAVVPFIATADLGLYDQVQGNPWLDLGQAVLASDGETVLASSLDGFITGALDVSFEEVDMLPEGSDDGFWTGADEFGNSSFTCGEWDVTTPEGGSMIIASSIALEFTERECDLESSLLCLCRLEM